MKEPAEGRAQNEGNNRTKAVESSLPRPRPALSCPAACLQRHVALFDGNGDTQATQCLDCDEAVTRRQWLLALEDAALEVTA
jgi:hypothetical protein